jgi:hypothetical protein
VIDRPRHDVAAYCCDPDNATAWYVNIRTVRWRHPMETTYEWTDGPAGSTTMTLRSRDEPSGFSAIAAPTLAMAMKRANSKDLARLKSILETVGSQARGGGGI